MSNTITLSDGTVISTATGQPVNGLAGHVVVPTAREAVTEVTRVRKRLADLPDAPEKMNIIAAVTAYSMFGLEDWEIAHAVGCTERQIGNIKMTAAYTDMIEALQMNIVEGQAEDVRQMLSRGARTAAQSMIDALTSQSEQSRIVAAKDVLDRSGHRPADVVEHRLRVDGGLTIEYVKRGGDEGVPTIDLNVEDEADGG